VTSLQRFVGVLIPSMEPEEASSSCNGRGSTFLRTAVLIALPSKTRETLRSGCHLWSCLAQHPRRFLLGYWVHTLYVRVLACPSSFCSLQPIPTMLLLLNPYSRIFSLVGQLAIEYPLATAAPEAASRRRRARSRRRLRLPFQTKGVGFSFQPSTVCSSHSMTSWAFLGC